MKKKKIMLSKNQQKIFKLNNFFWAKLREKKFWIIIVQQNLINLNMYHETEKKQTNILCTRIIMNIFIRYLKVGEISQLQWNLESTSQLWWYT